MQELEVLQAAYARTAALAGQVGSDDLDRPTPCADWTVRDLLDHVVAGTEGLATLVEGGTPDFGRTGVLGDDPAAAVRTALSRGLEAFAAEGAVDRESQHLPGMRVVDFAMADAVAHGWDLAAALGEPLGLPDAAVAAVDARWRGDAAETGRQYGAFGPAVDVPAGAPVLHRFLGLVGRDPGWRP